MYNFSKKSAKNAGKKYIPSGEYMSEVVKVEEHPDYVSGDAYLVSYKLENPSGRVYEHSETFRANGRLSSREIDFWNYLNYQLSMVPGDDFSGLREKVMIKKRSKDSGVWPSIVNREFVEFVEYVEEDDSDATDE